MENPLAKRFDQFCIDNHVTIVRGNLYQVEKVTGYESCLDLLKNHPRCPVDVVQLKPSIDSVIQIGKNIPLELRTDEITVEKSINIMKEIEKIDGFMFWNSSPEGVEFFKSNWGVIGSALTSTDYKWYP